MLRNFMITYAYHLNHHLNQVDKYEHHAQNILLPLFIIPPPQLLAPSSSQVSTDLVSINTH
jgi:hypothetical protein